MATPAREDEISLINKIERQAERAEKAVTDLFVQGGFYLPNLSTPPSPPGTGGILYVQGGALKYVSSSGTRTTIAPA